MLSGIFTKVNFPRVAVVGTMVLGGGLSFITGGSGVEVVVAAMIGPGTALLSHTAINLIRKAKGEQPLQLSNSGIEVSDIEVLGSLLAGAAVSKGVLHEESPVGVLKQTVAVTGTYLVAKTLHNISQQTVQSQPSQTGTDAPRLRTRKQH